MSVQVLQQLRVGAGYSWQQQVQRGGKEVVVWTGWLQELANGGSTGSCCRRTDAGLCREGHASAEVVLHVA